MKTEVSEKPAPLSPAKARATHPSPVRAVTLHTATWRVTPISVDPMRLMASGAARWSLELETRDMLLWRREEQASAGVEREDKAGQAPERPVTWRVML